MHIRSWAHSWFNQVLNDTSFAVFKKKPARNSIKVIQKLNKSNILRGHSFFREHEKIQTETLGKQTGLRNYLYRINIRNAPISKGHAEQSLKERWENFASAPLLSRSQIQPLKNLFWLGSLNSLPSVSNDRHAFVILLPINKIHFFIMNFIFYRRNTLSTNK